VGTTSSSGRCYTGTKLTLTVVRKRLPPQMKPDSRPILALVASKHACLGPFV